MIFSLLNDNIETNIGAYAINMIQYYKMKYNFPEKKNINAENAYNYGLALPIGMHLTQNDYELIGKNINSLSKSWKNILHMDQEKIMLINLEKLEKM